MYVVKLRYFVKKGAFKGTEPGYYNTPFYTGLYGTFPVIVCVVLCQKLQCVQKLGNIEICMLERT